jgi:hypothetical protein
MARRLSEQLTRKEIIDTSTLPMVVSTTPAVGKGGFVFARRANSKLPTLRQAQHSACTSRRRIYLARMLWTGGLRRRK